MEKLGFVQLTKVQGGFIAGTRRRAMDYRARRARCR